MGNKLVAMTSQNKQPLIFFGAGEISLAALKTASKLFVIEAVFTKPDTEHRGKTSQTPVKQWADTQDIPTFQPANAKELENMLYSSNFSSAMGFLVDYGVIISQRSIDFFDKGIVNSHFSLLPRLRGADPITAAILQGLDTTGVTLMQLAAGLDTGPIIAQRELHGISKFTIHELDDALMKLNDAMINDFLISYYNGEITPQNQDESQATMTHRLQKSDGEITLDKSASQVEREVRAYLSWPGSFFEWKGRRVIIKQAQISQEHAEPLELKRVGNTIVLGCHNGSIEILRLQLAGKKEMTAIDFINGHSQELQ